MTHRRSGPTLDAAARLRRRVLSSCCRFLSFSISLSHLNWVWSSQHHADCDRRGVAIVLWWSDPVQMGEGDREREKSAARTENSAVQSRRCIWGWAAASVSRSFSLSFSFCASVSSSLCASQFWKWFEGKIKTEMLLQDYRANFTVKGSYFPFDPIFWTNQTVCFTEKHFWN